MAGSIFSREKPNWKRLEQTEPPESELPELPEIPDASDDDGAIPSPAEIERRKALRRARKSLTNIQTIQTQPMVQQSNQPVSQQPQLTPLTIEEKWALFEWHWARAIEVYQEIKAG